VAHIVILTHADDEFAGRPFLLRSLASVWTRAGHRVTVAEGAGPSPMGDIAILHVDLSHVPGAYARVAKRYGRVINGRVTDIRKRLVSTNLLDRGDAWSGPVIVKTDLNCGGLPEARLHRIATRRGDARAASRTPFHIRGAYDVLPSLRDVPKAVWNNPDLVVERFLPEEDERGYWLRNWVFFGERERCMRALSASRIVKGAKILARERAPVPKELRTERERLGFDYGKFDFVVRDGKPILLDANRTPTLPPGPVPSTMAASIARLAKGIETFLK
jgi:hypothetical protein